MKNLKTIGAIFCAAVLSFALCGNTLEASTKPQLGRGPTMVTVKKVTAGDRFMALKDDSRDEIRCIIWGVEAQRTVGARQYLDQMIGGKRVQVEWKDPVFKQTRSDVHGSGSSRVPTYYLVEVKIKADKQWIFVGPEMIRQGCAKCRDDELKGALDGPYRMAQKYAKENRIGMWAIPGFDGEGAEGEGDQ